MLLITLTLTSALKGSLRTGQLLTWSQDVAKQADTSQEICQQAKVWVSYREQDNSTIVSECPR